MRWTPSQHNRDRELRSVFRLRPLWLIALFFTGARTMRIVGLNMVARITGRVAVSRVGLATLYSAAYPPVPAMVDE